MRSTLRSKLYWALKRIYQAAEDVVKQQRKRYREFKIREVAKSCGEDLSVNRPTLINDQTELGDNVNFNGLTVWGVGPLKIGDNFHSGKNTVIHTSRHAYKEGEAIPYDGQKVETPVEIGDQVWVGHSVIILGNTKIGDGAIIQAGSVVVDDIPELGIAGGNPAEVFAYRDEERYRRLEAEEAFF